MSQEKLARLMGVTTGEVARRIARIQAHCREHNLPCLIRTEQTPAGIRYIMSRSDAGKLRREMNVN